MNNMKPAHVARLRRIAEDVDRLHSLLSGLMDASADDVTVTTYGALDDAFENLGKARTTLEELLAKA